LACAASAISTGSEVPGAAFAKSKSKRIGIQKSSWRRLACCASARSSTPRLVGSGVGDQT